VRARMMTCPAREWTRMLILRVERLQKNEENPIAA